MGREHWHAPADDQGMLIDPPAAQIESLLRRNQASLQQARAKILGRPLRDWRVTADEIDAPTWNSANIPNSPPRGRPFVVAGHQPEMFHPGVWAKNFAIQALADKFGLTALHVLIDSDIVRFTSTPFPVFDPDPSKVRLVHLSFDDAGKASVFERRELLDKSKLVGFVDQSAEIRKDWNFEPILEEFWTDVTKRTQSQENPTWCALFCPPRRKWEREWGLQSLEQELSQLCGCQSFAALVGHILGDLPRFHRIYNACLSEYRRRHGVRSANHPVAALVSRGDLLEAPFWVIDHKTGKRDRFLVGSTGDQVQVHLPSPSRVFSAPHHRPFPISELAELGFAVRTRALTTTLFLRLFVADLFVHGIGGAKYDEVTDDIIRQYFGVEPPEYVVVSGTLRLPFSRFPARKGDRRRWWRALRDLDWNPERCIESPSAEAARWIAEKRRWVEASPRTSAERRERFWELQRLTQLLRAPAAGKRREIAEQLQRCDEELAANAILLRRDYPFVLYPREKLKAFLTQFLDL